MMKTTFNAGDKVRVKEGRARFPQGTVLTVKHGPEGSLSGGNYSFEERDGIVLGDNLELVEKKRKKSERIDALESEVAKLKEEVQALKQAKKPKYTLEDLLSKSPTPNQRRADVIKSAKEFVEKTITTNHRKVRSQSLDMGAWFVREDNGAIPTIKAEFIVNAEKRTVVALIKSRGTGGTVRAKGVANCNPDDVFNADIGKAIALGRALGLDVSEFEQAVQPGEVVVGMVVRDKKGGPFVGKLTKRYPCMDHVYGRAFKHTTDSGWVGEEQLLISEDTDANYTGE